MNARGFLESLSIRGCGAEEEIEDECSFERIFESVHLGGKAEVEETEASKAHVLGHLHNRRSGDEEQSVTVHAFTGPELLACKDALAFFTV